MDDGRIRVDFAKKKKKTNFDQSWSPLNQSGHRFSFSVEQFPSGQISSNFIPLGQILYVTKLILWTTKSSSSYPKPRPNDIARIHALRPLTIDICCNLWQLQGCLRFTSLASPATFHSLVHLIPPFLFTALYFAGNCCLAARSFSPAIAYAGGPSLLPVQILKVWCIPCSCFCLRRVELGEGHC